MVLVIINSYIFLAVFIIFIFSFSYFVTGYIRNYSLRNNVIDIPNERSSHLIPTPTGGGLSICISILLSIFIFASSDEDFVFLTLGLGGGVLLIGIVGWIDIHRKIAVLTRAVLYLIASIWSVLALGGMNNLSLGIYNYNIGWMGTVLAIVTVSWLVNLYNFMDGTDGLAAVQAICTGLYGAIFFCFAGHYSAAVICLAVVFSGAGFLIWNWAPAKIFMGDVGSCSLGFTFGVLAVYGEITDSIPLVIWFFLLAVFVSDASFTLLKRMASGETWYRAHNTHAYQRLTQIGVAHGKLAVYIFCLNIFVLGPLAYFVWVKPKYTVFSLFALYSILGLIWLLVHRAFSKSNGTC